MKQITDSLFPKTHNLPTVKTRIFNKNNRLFLLLLGGLLWINTAFADNPDITLLRQRFIAQEQARSVKDTKIENILNTFQPTDSIWPGIDYSDVRRIGFQHTIHLDNMVQMALAYQSKESKFYHDKRLKQVFDTALAFWIAHDFICDNWWNNEIGTPQAMVSILLIMDKDLTREQIDGILPIAGRAHINAWGARQSGDRIKIAGLQAKQCLFTRDAETFERIIRIIESEIKVVTGQRGIQSDYSFHHREDRVNNTLTYGTGYVDAFAEWAAMVTDTRYRFSDKQLQLAIDYYLDGICKQTVYGRTIDTGVKNREISRKGERRMLGTTTPEHFLLVTDYRHKELENIIKARKGEKFETIPFAKFFWQTEHFVLQRPKYYTSVRMYSVRNSNMESPFNGEGLTNHYRADGANYLSLTGYEYDKLPPVYDWRKIPGTTVLQKTSMPPEDEIRKWGITEFVGGVTDGLYGAAAFDFSSVHDPLRAHKSWFFFDEEYVCLGAGITSQTKDPVATTLDQTQSDGEAIIMSATGRETLSHGCRKIKKVRWVYHKKAGYIFPNACDVHISDSTQTGSWYLINRQTTSPKDTVREEVFKLWIDHGARPREAQYAYIVMPAADIQTVETAASAPSIVILSNTSAVQAVHHKKLGIIYAVFYRGGSIALSDKLSLEMDGPGMVMLRNKSDGKIKTISVADPTRKQTRIHLTLNQKVELRHEHCRTEWDATQGKTHLTIDLPQGEYAGQSITIPGA